MPKGWRRPSAKASALAGFVLSAAGRMTPHGQRHIDAAKADGRWDNAYPSLKESTHDTVPPDLRAAIEASPKARKTFRALSRQQLFVLSVRVLGMKSAAGRARRVAEFVEMLERGETIAPGETVAMAKPVVKKK